MIHIPVLLNETIKKLNIKKNGIYVDATLGLGGHSKAILQKLDKGGLLIVFEQDKYSLNFSKENLKKYLNIKFLHKNFNSIKHELKKMGIEKVDGILFDIGTSYYQLTNVERGFTYHGENVKLDMRMNQDQSKTVINILNEYTSEKLIKIFNEYGDEKKAKEIVEKIVEFRKIKKIETNSQLNSIIKSVKGFQKNKHPSKNVFQALRIELNNEIENLKNALNDAKDMLNPGGRVLVITFHSLEDKTVKKLFWEFKNEKEETIFETQHKFFTKKTIYPSKEEIERNNSARTAKLRILERSEYE